MIAFSTVSGGGVSALTGGNFWNGMRQGVITGTDRFGNPMNAGDIGVDADFPILGHL
ncbi:hypothetical protein [Myroides indicus]|uniref:Uncharacterized protein n=1 Tax=Myroides indicus TaxID=1323422 RepID=A0A4V3E7W5_9FLAO|nr:hypothetical protein [Myroides indicus]TDS55241.1 hypothetical protein C8P70_12312 [Myroides indicus]